jgi:chorismate dehydratase
LKKIRVAAVSYLNTKPLLYGIRHHEVFNEIELTENYPAKIAQMLIEDKVDIGLIPVAATTKLKEWHVVGDHCIGSEGPVASVCIFSEVPMEKIETVLLDYQSRTSVNLARILLKEYWKKAVTLTDASGEDYRSQIQGTTAGVVIGDRALEQRLHSKYFHRSAFCLRCLDQQQNPAGKFSAKIQRSQLEWFAADRGGVKRKCLCII